MSTKNIQKSVEIARQLFPESYSRRTQYQAFHFAFGFNRNTLIGIGQNDYGLNHKALKFARLFNVEERMKWPSLHAEISLFSKLWGKHYIDSSLKLVVIRLNKNGELQNSRPCHSCIQVIKALGVEKIWYSNKAGEIQYGL